MVKIEPRFLMLLLVFCILLIGCVANSQQTSSEEVRSEMVTTLKSKQDLARAVLSEAGTPKRYDLYLSNSVDISVNPETAKNDKFMAWIQALFVQEAGWNYIEAKYVAQLEANFSETELRELLDLAKKPLIRRLLQAEIESYAESARERRGLLFKLWDKYNSGMFIPPPEVLH